MAVGKSIPRVDAFDKVTGRAKYADDLYHGSLTGKVLHAKIANGVVKSMDITAAKSIPGVVKIITCFDVPQHSYPTAGHPWSVDPAHQDIADHRLLNTRVRFYGDDIAAVIAEDEIAAQRAVNAIVVEYEEYEPMTSVEQALAGPALHEGFPGNIVKQTSYELGNYDEAVQEPGLTLFDETFTTQFASHCHIENPLSFAYADNNGKVTIVASTQLPHICRRVTAQALGIPWGKVRVIKPYIGGGFGSKQDILYEPLNAYLTTQVGGRPVKLELTREETFMATRMRHSITMRIKTAVTKEGRLWARSLEAYANGGAYAAHGHAIMANAANCFRQLYQDEKATKSTTATVYTTLPPSGAMRGYGIPQAVFAMESSMDNIAKAMGFDPIEFRKKNMIRQGFTDPLTGIECSSGALPDCIDIGMKHIGWADKIVDCGKQRGNVRRGVGCAIFSYKTGVHPISLETSASRLVLNQDGSVQVQMGATEIGQGADTAFTQMAAQVLGIPPDMVYIVSQQDTDVTPFDPGAYASRQTYVSGMALKKAALLLRERILSYAGDVMRLSENEMDIKDAVIIEKDSGKALIPLAELSATAFYSLEDAMHLTAEASNQCKSNAFSLGCCFAEVEVDMALGKVTVLDVVNVHDSGTLINPQIARGQVHGGMSMGLGYALSEQLLFDDKGRLLNGNFLDYKLPTTMDTPDLHVDFVQSYEPTGPFGNKALGEPPAIPVGAAVRNAVARATGVPINYLPLSPQRLFESFAAAGKEV